MTYTIKEIEDKLAAVENESDPFFISCHNDERKGVQKLVARRKKQLQQERLETERLEKLTVYENEARLQGYQWIAGIDEVGRGPLAGPVVAAAVILPENCTLTGINDSKKLSSAKREQLYHQIMDTALSVGLGICHADDVDNLNIYEATKKAMNHAVNELTVMPDFLLLDAMEISAPIPQKSLIKGDALSISIAASSIIAKVHRDRLMNEYHRLYPMYRFNQNMGYGTKDHLEALEQYGPCPIHRKTFSPVKDMLELTLDI